MEEVEAREMHQIEQSLGEIHILHDDYPYLTYETMCQVKLAFCITYDLLYYYEYDVVKLYMLLRDDVNDLHYYAA